MAILAKIFSPITAPIRFVQNNFKSVVFICIVLWAVFGSTSTQTQTPNLMRIDLKGEIASSHEFLKQIQDAKAPNIKGVLLVVDSPGGAVSHSLEMMMAIDDLSKEKPVIAYATGSMASGSYYASLPATQIISNPGSLIGSIGVIFQLPNTKELLDKIGVKISSVKSGDYKTVGAFYQDFSEFDKTYIQALSDKTYQMFVGDVAKYRKLKLADANKFANGQIFVAKDALDLKLIDEIGSISYAKSVLIRRSGVNEPIWKEKSDFDKFLEKAYSEAKNFLVQEIIKPQGKLMAY